MSKILLISPPWRLPSNSSLALGTLRPILERAGLPTDTLYGNLLFPWTPSVTYLESWSSWLFLPHLYPQVKKEDAVAALLRHLLDEYNMQGVRYPRYQVRFSDLGFDEAELRAQALADVDRAGICLDRCVERAAIADYDVIGLSTTFESQLPAALAIARRVKALRPDVRIALGGAACFEMQGDGLAASFPEIDAVCHAEGEAVIVALMRALRGEGTLRDVPGIAYRDRDGVLHHNPSPPQLGDLDQLPIPEYDDFLAQFAASDWSKTGGDIADPQLFFETSRGCWWGQKHLCSFCGLNAEGLNYRKKSAQRVFDEIHTLYSRYPQVRYMQATDNILDMGFLKDPLPRLAPLARDAARPLRMFFESKSNLRADQVRVMSAGGITSVQPGIESFSDGILARMDKGATGLGQVQFVKYAYEAGINPVYNILVRNPGDRAEDYREMLELLPFIEHLPPPMGIVACLLERFSPYHSAPSRYGIRNVKPRSYYRELYPDAAVDLDRIAYIFDYDHDMLSDPELWEAQRAFVERAVAWTHAWQPGGAYYVDTGDRLVITDKRQGAGLAQAQLVGTAAMIYRFLDRVRPLARIEARFADVDRELLHTLLAVWLRRRWICRDRSDRYLAVLPRYGAMPLPVDLVEGNAKSLADGEGKGSGGMRRLPVLQVASEGGQAACSEPISG